MVATCCGGSRPAGYQIEATAETGEIDMTLTCDTMVSEDGYAAGGDQSLEHQLGGSVTSHALHLPGCALNGSCAAWSSVQLQGDTQGIIDAVEFLAADMAHALAEAFRRDSGCLLNEHERAFAADRNCRAKAAGARGTRGRGYQDGRQH